MFASINNIKHKAILFTAYSAGLRVSEAVKLRIQDIDSKRMEIFVQRAKGKKDRVVNLSPLVLDVLRQYMLCKSQGLYVIFLQIRMEATRIVKEAPRKFFKWHGMLREYIKM